MAELLDDNEQKKKDLYRKMLAEEATAESTRKYSFPKFKERLFGDEVLLDKVSDIAVKKGWSSTKDDFYGTYFPEIFTPQAPPAPPTKKATTIPPVGIAAPVAEPAPSVTDMGRQMAFQPAVQEPIEPIEPVGVMAPPAVQEPIPSITETAREMAFKPPVQPQMPEEEEEMSLGQKTGQTATELISGFNRALLKTPSSIVKTASELGVGVLNMLGGNMESEDAILYNLADKYDKWLDTSETARKFVGSPEYTGLAANVGSGLGQVFSMIAAGPQSASKALLSTPGVLKAVSQKMFSKPSLIAFSQVFNSEFENMKAKGESEQTAFNQGLVNAMATAPLENLPLINLAERLNKTIGVKLARRVLNAIQQGVEEGGQEAVQQIFSNLTNNQLVESEDNIVDWAQGIQPSAEAGGVVGLLIGGLANAKAARKYSKKPAAVPESEAIPAEEVQDAGYRTAYAKTREEIPVEYRNNVAEIERATTPLGRFGPMEKVFAYRVPTETIDITPPAPAEVTPEPAVTETAPVAEEVPFEEVPPVTEEATVAPLTEEELAQIEETELTPEEEAALLAQEEAAPVAPAEEAPTPEQRAEYGLEPLRPTYRGASMAEWQEIQGGKKFGSKEGFGENQGNVTWITDNKEYSQQQVEKNDDGVLIEFKPEAIDKSSVESGQQGDDTGVRLGRDLDINDVLRVTDKNGNVIYESTSAAPATEEVVSAAPVEEVAPEAPAALPKELLGEITISSTGFGGDREHTTGKVKLQELKVLDVGIETARQTLETDKSFKPSKEPIVVGVDVNTGEKQLLDGYHRYLIKNGKGEVAAKFIPMRNGEIISFEEAKTPAAPAPKGRKKKEVPVTPAPAAPKPIEFGKQLEKKYGVRIDLLGKLDKGDLTLSRIEVPQTERGKGIGSKIMEEIIKYADENGKRIVLSPTKEFGATSVDRLRKFYKGFGFVENKGSNKDFTIKELMYRLPAKAEPAPVAEKEEGKKAEAKEERKETSFKGIASFETAKGSVYTVLPDGRTQRFKTATKEQNEPQDLTVFVKFKDAAQEQDFLEGIQRSETSGTKVYVIDKQGNKYDTNAQAAGKDVRLALVKDGKVIDTAETSTTPKIGYNTFDQRRFEKDGEKYRQAHLGNKVVKINEQTKTEAKPPTPSFTSQQSSEAATAFDKAKTSKGFDKKYGKGAYKALSDITKNFDAIMDKVSDKIKQDCL